VVGRFVVLVEVLLGWLSFAGSIALVVVGEDREACITNDLEKGSVVPISSAFPWLKRRVKIAFSFGKYLADILAPSALVSFSTDAPSR
jgi:hypothetical protein